MGKARPLVDGFLERISVTAFEKYQQEITELVRSEHGVYALYLDEDLYYVGLAANLRRRVGQHLRDRHAGLWDRFSLYLVRRVDHIKEIESLLLRIADPAGNKQSGKLRSATNLKARLKSMLLERQRAELDEILRTSKRVGKSTAKQQTARKARPRKKGRATRPGNKAKADRPLKGLVGGGKRLYAIYKGYEYWALVYNHGRIKYDGRFYDSPSHAARAVTGRQTNGWTFWRVRKDGELVKLHELRQGS